VAEVHPAARAYIDFTDTAAVAKEGLRRQVCDLFMENQQRTLAH
jgi:para-nitrobenzyl esterase